MKVLAVEDSKETQALINLALRAKFSVDFVDTCAEALRKIRTNDYACVLMDINLPDGNGLSLLQELAHMDGARDTAFILLTADKSISSIMMGFNLGADDYIVKPFDPLELFARVDSKVNRRRIRQAERNILRKGPFEFDLENFKVFLHADNKKVELAVTLIEFKLLLKLAQSSGRILTRQNLIDQVWGSHYFIDERSVDKHISALRQKIRPFHQHIKTRSGLGYCFDTPMESPRLAT